MNSLSDAKAGLAACNLVCDIVHDELGRNYLLGATKSVQNFIYESEFSIEKRREVWCFSRNDTRYTLYFSDLAQCVKSICTIYTGVPMLVEGFKLPEFVDAKLHKANLKYVTNPYVENQRILYRIFGGPNDVDMKNLDQYLSGRSDLSGEDYQRGMNDLSRMFRIYSEGGMIVGYVNQYEMQNGGLLLCSPRLETVIDVLCNFYITSKKPDKYHLIRF